MAMAYRLIFRFERADYSESARADTDREIKITVQQKLDQKTSRQLGFLHPVETLLM